MNDDSTLIGLRSGIVFSCDDPVRIIDSEWMELTGARLLRPVLSAAPVELDGARVRRDAVEWTADVYVEEEHYGDGIYVDETG